jgi:ComF family protein
MLRKAVDSILASIYPQQCLVCGNLVETHSDGVACAACWSLTRLFDGSQNLCGKCGALQDGRLDAKIASCPNCHDAYYDAAFAAGAYEKALAATIVRLKRKPELPARLIDLIEQLSFRIEQTRPTVIIPVPLSRSRKHERGFNQAEILADVISKRTGLDVTLTCLVRSKQTPMHRVAMDKRARELTVEKAFEVRGPRLVAGKDVVLVDDVFTSGATASACARVLKKNGAGKVTVVTLARAVLYN